MILVEGFDTTELRVSPDRRAAGAARVVLPRRPGVRDYPDHLADAG